MSNKRVKRVHISGWLDVFLTDTIMARIAHHLSTPALFQLLLGVNKELRKKATTSKRWNQIMDYQDRVVGICRRATRFSDKQNILQKFVTYRLYSPSVCSFCFAFVHASHCLYERPRSYGMKMCGHCGASRGLLVRWDKFHEHFARSPSLCVSCPDKMLYRHELDTYEPKYYQERELHEVWSWMNPPKGAFCVMDCHGITKLVMRR
jgi:hypothetical protein